LVIIFKKEPQNIYCAQNGSHLVIGLGQDEIIIASESRAFEKYTKNILEMKDGEILQAGIDKNGKYCILNKEVQLAVPKVER
jgi:glucosamine 6-phosphate synthetase-like amidotransferase/phosphosugar isomerase protein